MIGVDDFNPMNRFLLRKDQHEEVAPELDPTKVDQKVVPIKPPKVKPAHFWRISVTQLMLVPIAISGIYFYSIARDRYVTRSDFVIRKAEEAGLTDPGTGLAGLLARGNQLSLEDARFLKTYLQSPQVLADLTRTFDLDKAYAQKGSDPFAGIKPNLSNEKRLKFFKKQVAVTLDELSGAIVLRTVGLDPKASYDLNRFMLAKSEHFVNQLNQDISQKQKGFAEEELIRARSILNQAKNRLLIYQESNAVIDPKSEAELASQTISKLQEKLVDLRVELATLRRQFKDPAEPEVAAIEDQVRELEQQIQKERKSAVSRQGRNLTRKAADMLKLESDVAFATDSYKLALTAVEKARVESKRQQKFMALLSAPQRPEDPQNDWRSKGFFAVVAACAVGLSLGKFVLGMQASHRQ
ncbi:MAG: sugar ABC transporter [Cyanobacteria bacterium K_Offshore_surface_m2_239]|nr:sugar ABC transporter [Cyanobacteria bacterium K_Offshore_surface_m2_239]